MNRGITQARVTASGRIHAKAKVLDELVDLKRCLRLKKKLLFIFLPIYVTLVYRAFTHKMQWFSLMQSFSRCCKGMHWQHS
jgi:putative effector of murein hydrolase LrgA (UPF0299 family)